MDNALQPNNGANFDQDEHQPTMMPLGTGGDADGEMNLDPLAGAGTVKRSYGGLLLIAGVLVVAGGGLFSMRYLSQASAEVTSDAEIEDDINSLIRDLNDMDPDSGVPGADGLVGDVYVARHVPLDEVQKNPFLLALGGGEDPGPALPFIEDDTAQRRAARRAEMESAGNTLRLTSTFMGSKPMARINDALVRVQGEVLVDDITFVVTSIEKDQATVTAVDPELDVQVRITLVIERP